MLLGGNGSGKSTVLKAISLVMAGSDALTELIGETDSWIKEGAETGSITAQIETTGGEEREISLKFIRGEKRSRFFQRAITTTAALDAALEHTHRSYLTVAYGTSRRLSNGGVSIGSGSGYSHPRARSLASLFDTDAEVNPVESWAMQLDYSSDGKHLGLVREVLSDFLPDTTFSHIDKMNKRLMFETPEGVMPLAHATRGNDPFGGHCSTVRAGRAALLHSPV